MKLRGLERDNKSLRDERDALKRQLESKARGGDSSQALQLAELITENSTEPAGEMLGEILDEYRRFTRGVVQEDDLTLVVVKIA